MVVKKSSSEVLQRFDKSFKWTFLHALFAVTNKINKSDIKATLRALHTSHPSLLRLLLVKDDDGDLPIHSAVRTGNIGHIQALVELADKSLPIDLKKMFEARNNMECTPLQLACDWKRYDIVELLLEICVREEFCEDVTGVPYVVAQSAEILYKALGKGNWKILGIFLNVFMKFMYDKRTIVQILNLPNKRDKATAWFYLMECSPDILRNVCELLEEYNLHLDDLHVDDYGSTMLHLAYRVNAQDKIHLLEEFKGDPEHKNERGYMACERAHTLDDAPLSKSSKVGRRYS